MEIDTVTLREVLEQVGAALESGIPIRRLKCGELEIELAQPPAPQVPVVAPTRERGAQASDDPYDVLFKGQKPAFPKFTAE